LYSAFHLARQAGGRWRHGAARSGQSTRPRQRRKGTCTMVTSVRIAVLAGLAAVAFSQPAAAHSVKPGLWEMTINSKMAGGGLPAGMMPNTMKMKVCIQPEESKADL